MMSTRKVELLLDRAPIGTLVDSGCRRPRAGPVTRSGGRAEFSTSCSTEPPGTTYGGLLFARGADEAFRGIRVGRHNPGRVNGAGRAWGPWRVEPLALGDLAEHARTALGRQPSSHHATLSVCAALGGLDARACGFVEGTMTTGHGA
jgi:hypothetical protein